MADIAIESSQLVVTKAKKQILNKLTFTVKKGTITGLIGPSGSGKTTRCAQLLGTKISGGEIAVLGQLVTNHCDQKLDMLRKSPAVYPDLTVVQNLRYFAVLVRASRSNVEQVIEQVQLTNQRDQLAASLSGGQLARVSLAVALLGSPDLLVLDEPTVGLDPVLRNELWELFAELAASGKTLLVSSHVMDEAERCDDLLLLRDGRLLWNDSRDKLLSHTKQKSVGDAFITMIKHGEVK